MHARHRDRARAAFDRVATQGSAGEELDALLQHRDGRWAWTHLSMAPLPSEAGAPAFVLVQSLDVDAEMEARESIASSTLTDPLTGAGSRLAALRAVRDAVAEAAERTDGLRVGVAIVDLDGFGALNAALGTDAGDQVLTTVARRLASEAGEGSFVGRWAGDEFLVLLRDAGTDLAGAGERLQDVVARPMEVAGVSLVVTARIGVAVALRGGPVRDLVRDAEAALGQARARREGRVRAAPPGAGHGRAALFEATELVRAALGDQRVVAYFQPVCGADDLAVRGWEALVRIRRPDGSLAMPADFLNAAEASGLMLPLGQEMLRQSAAHAARWPGPDGPLVGVNLSVRQLREPDLGATVRAVLAGHGVPLQRLVVEVTEDLLKELDDHGLSVLQALRDDGAAVALDDFGSGYSSLGQLVDLPLSLVKLDRRFLTSGPTQTRRSVAVMHAVVELCHDLGLQVVAEGVETTEQLGLVRGLGVDLVQGFLLGRPAPAPDCLAWPRTARPEPGPVGSLA